MSQAVATSAPQAEAKVVEQPPAPKPEPVVEKPQPVQTPPEPKPVRTTGCGAYAHLLAKYNWNQRVMAQVMQAESGCNPNAIGDTRTINGIYAPSCGLFQVRTLKGRPSCAELQDPATNIAWAYRIYQGQGMSAWSVCSNGKVRCY